MSYLQNYYLEKCNIPSEINEHLPFLFKYAKECESIIEMGTQDGVSIYALAYARPKILISIDILPFEGAEYLKELCEEQGTEYEHIIGSSLNLEIPEIDFLFIDTEHSYLQLKSELKRHGNKAKKYLAFHDTVTFGFRDSNAYGDQGLRYEEGEPGRYGLIPAIQEFLIENPHWEIDSINTNNNGMVFLKRK